MALYDLQEQERIDDLKAWWARYGSAIATALVLACLVIVGVQGYRYYQGKRSESASVLYSAVSEASRNKDAAKAKDAIAELTDRYAKTGYAPRAALLYAKMLYDAGDRNGAKAQYAWVVDHAAEDEVKAIARYRLAQVLLDEKQYDAALAALDAKHPDAFSGMFADLRGDVFAAAGRNADARTAYENAIAKLDAKSQYRNYVQVKLDALGGARAASGSAPPKTEAGPNDAVASKTAAPEKTARTGAAK